MITTRIQIEPYLAEYVQGKYYDESAGTVRFPSSSDIYITVYDLVEKRPVNCPANFRNLSPIFGTVVRGSGSLPNRSTAIWIR